MSTIQAFFSLTIIFFISYLHINIVSGFVTRVTGRVPLVELELLIFPEHMCSPPDFGGVRVTQSLV
jgi:hypothetical protein